jgi:hypothetical protein
MEMNPTSIEKVKKLLKNSQETIETGLRKQLIVYDKIDDNKKRKEAKSAFILAYKSIFNDSINVVIAEVCQNKRLIAKMKEKTMTAFGIARKIGLIEQDIQSAIDGINNVSDEKKEKIAKALGCKIEEIFD